MRREVMQAWLGEGELSYRTGATLLAGSGVVLSFTAIVFRGVDEATDWQFLTVRGLSAAAAMVVLTLARSRRRPVPFRDVTWRVAIASVLLAGMGMLFILALARTNTATVTFLVAAGPLSGAFFGRVFLGERLTSITVAAMATAAVGIGLMASGGFDGSGVGFFLAALIPLGLGLYNMLIRSAPALDPVIPSFLASFLLGAVSAGVALTDGGLAMSLRDAALGAVAGFVLIGIGLPMMNLGHRAVPTAQISLLMMTELVLAPVWVWIWPGETPSTTTLLGGAIVIAGVVGQVRWSGSPVKGRAAAVPPLT